MEVFDLLAAPGYPVFLGSEFEPALPKNARFHILPIPYEESVSYGEVPRKGRQRS
jgi:agmatinase